MLRGDQLSNEERDALSAAARVVLLSRHGTLAEQVLRLLRRAPAARAPEALIARPPDADVPPPRLPLEFFNGLGGFSEDGSEYVTILGERQWTPAPWINVLANASFGCLTSESGSGYTWAVNSRENQLTQWSNDPVGDPPGEALFVRDEDTGEVWCPTPLPIRNEGSYLIRHGQGYSRFTHEHHGIATELLLFVPREDPVKVSRLFLENRSGRARTLTVTGFTEWVLGTQRGAAAPFIVTELDETGALFARNSWNEAYAGRVAFVDAAGQQSAWTADRTEFLGRNGGLDAPAGLAPGVILSQRSGAGLDPCAALQVRLRLEPGQRLALVFLLGQGADAADARRLVLRYRSLDLDSALGEVRQEWEDTLTALQVRTPDRSMNLMLNRWLLYQAIASRYRARSAFYQAGGAWGFRDQLQDVMSFTVARRELARSHLLRAASRQFEEGDVQHWWHEPEGKGVRTRISDDLLWLPYATRHYVEVTGDQTVLDETVPFLSAPPLNPEEMDRYFQPQVSERKASLYEHCARALDHGLAVGSHGLPLMGTGDWNDGMNRVGAGGHGESVWLGWFLLANLEPFAIVRGEERRRGTRPRLAGTRRGAQEVSRARGLGRRLVSPRLLRRRDAARVRLQRRVPYRLDRPVVGDHLRRRGSRASPAGDGSRRRTPDSSRGRPGPSVRASLRPNGARTGLHQGLRAGGPGERRPVHACGRVGRDRVCRAGRRGQGGRALLGPESDQPRQHARGPLSLQGRALRHGRRRLFRAAAHRPRGLDLVHGCGRLDVSGGSRMDPGIPAPRYGAARGPLHPARVAAFRRRLPLPLRPLPPRGRKPERSHARRGAHRARRAARRRGARFRSRTMPART